ncbi:MAG: adenosine deaminase [Candidatus Sumerlaeia bacterium]|nr:adenosine deaminase [Candidatus Sumerlaeia bacterium]
MKTFLLEYNPHKQAGMSHQALTREILHSLPKAELHCHLDGSMRVETIIELARKQGVSLPSFDAAELRKVMVQDKVRSLVEYLKAFDITLSVLQDYESLKRAAYEMAEDAAKDNVVYLEVRFAPILHQQRGMRLTSVLDAVLDGLREAERDFGIRSGVIVCAMRMSDPKYSVLMAELCVMYKHRGVVGFDLAGAEAGNPALDHREAFQLVLRNNVNITIHAGEAYGPESISQALHFCGAHRLGHAVRLKEDGDLLNYCADHRTPLEICLTSNRQTNATPDLRFHPLRMYYDYGLRVCLCTDNVLVSGTTLTDEFLLAHEVHNFSLEELKDIIVFTVKSSFLHHREKVDLLHDILRRLKSIQLLPGTAPTGAAVADIPTETFTKSHATV